MDIHLREDYMLKTIYNDNQIKVNLFSLILMEQCPMQWFG